MTSAAAHSYAYLMHFSAPVSIGIAGKRNVRHHFGTTNGSVASEMHAAAHGEHASAIVMAAHNANVKVSIGYAARTDHHPARELTSAYARAHCKHCIAERAQAKRDAGMLELLARSVELKTQRRLFK